MLCRPWMLCLPRLAPPAAARLSPAFRRRIFPPMSRLPVAGCSSDSCGDCDDSRDVRELMAFLDRLKNYERAGVPAGAGTDTDDGFDLGRMRRLLRQLGDPHARYKAVHIAGTKGKGSVASYMSNILRHAGYNVGCYTSPRLLSIRDCISVGRSSGPVPAKLLMDHFHRVKGTLEQSIKSENGALTYFEVLTALTYSLFAQEMIDIGVIECGLGGARDATNVIRSKELAVAVITSIGKEHMEALGGSLENIAIAKSGIIKEGCPVVIGGPFNTGIEHIIRERASLMNAPVISACDSGIQCVTKGPIWEEGKPHQCCDIIVQIIHEAELFVELHNLKLQMVGDHQVQNSVTAICASLCLRNEGWNISNEAIRVGLEITQLRGRSQFLSKKEASAFGLDSVNVLLDGAHTEDSGKALSNVIKCLNIKGALALVVAMASDKDHLQFACQLLSGRRPDVVLLTETSVAGGKSRSTPASELKKMWIKAAQDKGINAVDIGNITAEGEIPNLNLESTSSSSERDVPILIAASGSPVAEVMKLASNLMQSRSSSQERFICVTGSLHIVAAVLRLLDESQ